MPMLPLMLIWLCRGAVARTPRLIAFTSFTPLRGVAMILLITLPCRSYDIYDAARVACALIRAKRLLLPCFTPRRVDACAARSRLFARKFFCHAMRLLFCRA